MKRQRDEQGRFPLPIHPPRQPHFRRPLGSGSLHFHRQETPPRIQEIDIYLEETPTHIREIASDIQETTSRSQETPPAAKKSPRVSEK
jgi:hypothetical protein